MHFRRIACLLLGAWFAGSVFLDWMVPENLRGVDRVLAEPAAPARLPILTLGHDTSRLFLRYQVSELNRSYVYGWERTELVIGTLLFLVLVFGSHEGVFTIGLIVLMVFVTAAQHFVVTPHITALARSIDFFPAELPDPTRDNVVNLQTAYFGMEIGKWALGLVLAARMVVRHRRGRKEPL